jgi:hypothetical protein
MVHSHSLSHIQKIQRIIVEFYNHDMSMVQYESFVDKIHEFQCAFEVMYKYVNQMTHHALREHYQQQLAMDCSSFTDDSLHNILNDGKVDKFIHNIVKHELLARSEVDQIRESAISLSTRLMQDDPPREKEKGQGILYPKSNAPWITTLHREYQSIIDSWHKQPFHHKNPVLVPFESFVGSRDEIAKRTLWLNGMLWMCRKHPHDLGFVGKCATYLGDHLHMGAEFNTLLQKALMNYLEHMCIAISKGDIDYYNKYADIILTLRNLYPPQKDIKTPDVSYVLELFPTITKDKVYGCRFKGLYVCNTHPLAQPSHKEALYIDQVIYRVNHELPIDDHDVVYIFKCFEEIIKHPQQCNNILVCRCRVSKAFMDMLHLMANDHHPHSIQYDRIVSSHLYNLVYSKLIHHVRPTHTIRIPPNPR